MRLRRLAEIIHREGDAAMAVFVGCIRVEELCKVSMLLDTKKGVITGGSWSSFWTAFRRHEEKWLQFKLRTMNPIKGMNEQEREDLYRKTIGNEAGYKNLAMYVDHRDGQEWTVPSRRDFEGQVAHVLVLGDHAMSEAHKQALSVGVTLAI